MDEIFSTIFLKNFMADDVKLCVFFMVMECYPSHQNQITMKP